MKVNCSTSLQRLTKAAVWAQCMATWFQPRSKQEKVSHNGAVFFSYRKHHAQFPVSIGMRINELHESRRIMDVAPDDRPRERLAASGTQGLSDTELIAVLLGSGVKGRPVHAVAAEVVALFDRGGVPSIPDLELIPGMGPAKAAVVAAALEFSRRVYSP
ncbi:MAG: hypothetical protein EA428_05555, partial [Spirochaetaceae bacterium]